MLRSMYSGISGMKNFQTKLDVIGNNIANVNTFGFKKGRVTFKDTMNQMVAGASAAQENRGGKNPMQVGLGSTLASIDTIHTGSSLQTTGRSLDLGIDGDGYFVVKQGESQLYTRAGNFYLDDNGTLVNGDGFKVQSYDQGMLKDITVNVNAVLPAIQTKTIDLIGNLPKDITSTPDLVQQIKVIDKAGKAHTLDMKFQPDDASTGKWKVIFSDNTLTNAEPVTAEITIEDDPSSASSIAVELKVNKGDGTAETLAIALEIKNLTKDTGSLTAMANPDGNTEGALESFNIGAMGEVNGVYSNGKIASLGTIALAKFSNSSGLTKAGNNLFQESINSGTANINTPGNGRGSIAPGSLEMSNVDLSEEFTEMITAQRGFQANTRIITTSDEILQELVNLKR